MTVCYLIQSHRDPDQIVRLVRTLRNGSQGPIVVWHDFQKCPLDTTPLSAVPDVHVVPAKGKLVRAGFSAQAGPWLDATEWIHASGLEYSWLINISAQDYPVKPLDEIESSLEASDVDGFLAHWDVSSPESPWPPRKARARYHYRYWRLPDVFEPLLRATRAVTKVTPLHFYLDYGPWIGVRCVRTPFSRTFRCYGGWAFFTLRREAVRYVHRFLAERPEVEKHYRRTIAAEESLVPTVLANSGRFSLVPDSLRLIDYSQAVRGSPRTLTVADFPQLASGRYHFARKFDLNVDREVLDRIDRELLGM